MFCKKCGNEISNGSRFCPVCGQLVNTPRESVGVPQANPNAMSTAQTQYVTITSNKSRKTAIILCIFVGWLGIHRFYVGKIISGIVYLCTFGVAGIGILIDLIKLLLGQFTDNVGQPLRR